MQEMKSEDPLLSSWQETLDRRRSRPAILAPTGEGVRTFGDIETRASKLGSQIDHLPAGSVLAIQIGNHEDWASVVIACLRKKIVILPLEQLMSAEQRAAAFEVCQVSAVIAPVRGGRELQVSPLKTAPNGFASGAATPDWAGDAPSLLKLTSGTTAAPRAVRFRSQQLLADCDQICDTMGFSEDDLNFGVIPISHSYGFSNLLTPLIARGVPLVQSNDRTPRAVLADLAQTKATVFPGMPVFYQAFCEMENPTPLPSLRLCISAGAPLSVSAARMFESKFGLGIHSFYGASECGGICYDRDARNEVEGLVGEPMQNVDLEIIDPSADASQVRVRSAAAGDGYWPEPDPDKLGAGAFVPDDLLVQGNSGFRIVGRISDLINVAGKKLNPAIVETVLLRFPGVRQAVAFGRPAAAGLRNEEIAVCVTGSVDLTENVLISFCRTELSPWQVPKRIFVVEAIPTNERGKISRRELALRFGG
jgi:long-chain acyl-CoA synthetase